MISANPAPRYYGYPGYDEAERKGTGPTGGIVHGHTVSVQGLHATFCLANQEFANVPSMVIFLDWYWIAPYHPESLMKYPPKHKSTSLSISEMMDKIMSGVHNNK
jgi:hypothetical protein